MLHSHANSRVSCQTLPPSPPFRRIVVKVGSSLLVDSAAGALKRDWLASLAADIAALHKDKRDVLVVSSGAIALGRAVLKLPAGALKLEEARPPPRSGRSRWRARGRSRSARTSIAAGQVLLTLGDTEERRRYLNARSTIDKLLEWRSVPVINENDTVATSRNPLRRQRPARRARRHHDERRPAGAAVRRRRALRQAAGDRAGGAQAGAAGRAHHAGDRGDGGRVAAPSCRAAAC